MPEMQSFNNANATNFNVAAQQEAELTPEEFRTLYFDREFILRFTNHFGMLLSSYISRDFKNNCPMMAKFVEDELKNPSAMKYKPALEIFKTIVACPKTFRHLLMCLQNIAEDKGNHEIIPCMPCPFIDLNEDESEFLINSLKRESKK